MPKELVKPANTATMPWDSAWPEAAALLIRREKGRPVAFPAAANLNGKAPRGTLCLGETKVARRLITICAWCKKIRSSQGVWRRHANIQAARRAEFSHGICPACAEETYNAYRYPKVVINAKESSNYQAPARNAAARAAVAVALA